MGDHFYLVPEWMDIFSCCWILACSKNPFNFVLLCPQAPTKISKPERPHL